MRKAIAITAVIFVGAVSCNSYRKNYDESKLQQRDMTYQQQVYQQSTAYPPVAYQQPQEQSQIVQQPLQQPQAQQQEVYYLGQSASAQTVPVTTQLVPAQQQATVVYYPQQQVVQQPQYVAAATTVPQYQQVTTVPVRQQQVATVARTQQNVIPQYTPTTRQVAAQPVYTTSAAPIGQQYVGRNREQLTLISGRGLSSYSVVVGAFGIRQNAEKCLRQLVNANYPAQIVYNNQRNLYYVVATTYTNHQSALQSRSLLSRAFPGAWILQ